MLLSQTVMAVLSIPSLKIRTFKPHHEFKQTHAVADLQPGATPSRLHRTKFLATQHRHGHIAKCSQLLSSIPVVIGTHAVIGMHIATAVDQSSNPISQKHNAMLKGSLLLIAGDNDAATSVKIRISVDSRPEQIDAQIKEAFNMEASDTYTLTSDGEICSLETIVHSTLRWIQAGDADATPEYECEMDGVKATFPLSIKVKSATSRISTGTTGSGNSTGIGSGSEDSKKRKREHREWEQLAWQVRLRFVPALLLSK
jgi:hypothetical protein